MARFWVESLAGDEDLEAVLEVEAESFTNPWTREMYESEFRNRSACHVLVVRSEVRQVEGFCAFWLVCDEVHINNLAIRPQTRRQGAGGLLVRAVLKQALTLGANRATLEVRESNAEARRLYERLGFSVSGTRRGYYTNPVEDALILWWDRAGPPAASNLCTPSQGF
jgi:ribosomal-protein-alanine N-acetyltransferase